MANGQIQEVKSKKNEEFAKEQAIAATNDVIKLINSLCERLIQIGAGAFKEMVDDALKKAKSKINEKVK